MAFFKRLLPTALTIFAGVATLALYFVPLLRPELAEGALVFRAYWIQVAVVIAAFAILLGIFNLLAVHWSRLRRRGGFYSFITVLAFWLVFILSVIDMAGLSGAAAPGQAWFARGISGRLMTWTYQYILYPLQASFTALLAFLLAFAAYRTLRLRRGVGALLFLVGALIILLAQAAPLVPLLPELRDWFVNVWGMAGLRGVILGAALGAVATMVRVLLGFERPASE